LKRPLAAVVVTRFLDGENRLRFLATEGRTVCREGLRKDMAKSRAHCKKQSELNLNTLRVTAFDFYHFNGTFKWIVHLSHKPIVSFNVYMTSINTRISLPRKKVDVTELFNVDYYYFEK